MDDLIVDVAGYPVGMNIHRGAETVATAIPHPLGGVDAPSRFKRVHGARRNGNNTGSFDSGPGHVSGGPGRSPRTGNTSSSAGWPVAAGRVIRMCRPPVPEQHPLLRDYLRSDDETARRYGRFKQAPAGRQPARRSRCVAEKSAHVKEHDAGPTTPGEP